ncbi:MAG: STAS domain-containing protein [Bryobacteraceae bacterium]|nr:STAS domain-containing protein [Bryobacteraceae bacterium]
MPLSIREREKEGVQILDLKGRLTVGEEVALLREKLRTVTDAGHKRVILNMKEIDYVDSTGLGSLVICFTSLQKAGGTLKLLNVSRRNIELLVLTKLTTVFELFNDEQDAVNSFFPGRQISRFDILNFVQSQSES